jgi:hypothetical protein
VGSLLRSPSTFFLGEAEAATALDAAEMVGAMKLFAPPPLPVLERASLLGILAASRCWLLSSFSFSAHDGREEARPPPLFGLFLPTETLLCGESAGKQIARGN